MGFHLKVMEVIHQLLVRIRPLTIKI